jgi:hypothetical protein
MQVNTFDFNHFGNITEMVFKSAIQSHSFCSTFSSWPLKPLASLSSYSSKVSAQTD